MVNYKENKELFVRKMNKAPKKAPYLRAIKIYDELIMKEEKEIDRRTRNSKRNR